jgi:hypothetical protein
VTRTFTNTEGEAQIEGRVFLLDGKAWLLTEPAKRLYLIDDTDFLDDCRKHVKEIPHMTAALIVRRERSTDVSEGGFNYLPHTVSSSRVSVPMMTVHFGRESFWVKTPVLSSLVDQDIVQELPQ